MQKHNPIVQEARQWIGTPYSDGGRRKHQGTDCIGLILGVIRRVGADGPTDTEMPYYGPLPANHVAERTADRWMDVVGSTWDSALPGRVGLFWWRDKNHGQHFAIFTPLPGRLGMVHAYMNNDQVVEASVSAFWRKRLIKVYEMRGAEQ